MTLAQPGSGATRASLIRKRKSNARTENDNVSTNRIASPLLRWRAFATPPGTLPLALGATITPAHLMAITPSAPPHCGPVPGISSIRRHAAVAIAGQARFTTCWWLRQYPFTVEAVSSPTTWTRASRMITNSQGLQFGLQFTTVRPRSSGYTCRI